MVKRSGKITPEKIYSLKYIHTCFSDYVKRYTIREKVCVDRVSVSHTGYRATHQNDTHPQEKMETSRTSSTKAFSINVVKTCLRTNIQEKNPMALDEILNEIHADVNMKMLTGPSNPSN